MSDPIIERVRAARRAISAECRHDLDRLGAHYAELQERYADRLVAEPAPKPEEAQSPPRAADASD